MRNLSLLFFLFAVVTLKVSADALPDFDKAVPIPDSTVAKQSGQGIVAGKLSCATERYAHAVLGDAIEAGCLIVVDESGDSFGLTLPESQVFEDLEPRIADMNGCLLYTSPSPRDRG